MHRVESCWRDDARIGSDCVSATVDGYTLVLESSTYAGSVAVLRGAEIVAERDVEMRGREEERLMPAVAECAGALEGGLSSVRRVVCGSGPGSFTSLRIAAAISKGICHARGLPLYQVSSLALIVAGSPVFDARGCFMPILDAMRGEVFTTVFDAGGDGAIVATAPVRIVPRSRIEEEASAAGAVLLDGTPRARNAGRLLYSILQAGPVDLGGWEPEYGRAAEAQVKWEASHGRPLPR